MHVVEIKLKGSKADSHMRFAFNVQDEEAERVEENLMVAKEGGHAFLVFKDANMHTRVFCLSEIREVHIKGDKVEA